MIYLATPYSNPDESVREQRYQDACRLTALLVKFGHHVFSPSVHSHPLVKHGLPGDWAFWLHVDRKHFDLCSKLWVAKFAGWCASTGISVEIEWAKETCKPIRYIDPSEWLE